MGWRRASLADSFAGTLSPEAQSGLDCVDLVDLRRDNISAIQRELSFRDG